MKVRVIVNAAAGPESEPSEDQERIRSACAAAGIECQLMPVPAERLADAAREAGQASVDAIVAAGGDGTVSAVAGVLAGSPKPLGVLPIGTLNHFAKDLGLPLDLNGAARVIAAGHVRAIDVGEVNGRVFINNSSIGLYPRIVQERDEQRQRLGRGKWPAMLSASLLIFQRYPVVHVGLHTPEGDLEERVPFVFVGNNEYKLDLLSLGGRGRLDGGALSVYLTRRTGRLGLLVLAARALLGRLNAASDFRLMLLPEAVVQTRRHRLRVAVDGEVFPMEPPLRYRIRPKALRVIAAADSGS